jgi:hypothetical protein
VIVVWQRPGFAVVQKMMLRPSQVLILKEQPHFSAKMLEISELVERREIRVSEGLWRLQEHLLEAIQIL